MSKEDIHLDDIKRILLGDAPAIFMLEVFLRTVVIYFFLLAIVRLLGNRLSGQITIMEMAVMLTLAAIVAAPMQLPDRGLLQGILALCCALAFQRGVNWLTVRHKKAEELVQGRMSILVKDGVLQVQDMEDLRISREQLFSTLRKTGIKQLGEVERVYLEACGLFSVLRSQTPAPGLSVWPSKDTALHSEPGHAVLWACGHCGRTTLNHNDSACRGCRKMDWEPAVTVEK